MISTAGGGPDGLLNAITHEKNRKRSEDNNTYNLTETAADFIYYDSSHNIRSRYCMGKNRERAVYLKNYSNKFIEKQEEKGIDFRRSFNTTEISVFTTPQLIHAHTEKKEKKIPLGENKNLSERSAKQ